MKNNYFEVFAKVQELEHEIFMLKCKELKDFLSNTYSVDTEEKIKQKEIELKNLRKQLY